APASPTTRVAEVYNARMLSALRGWIDDFTVQNNQYPASVQQLLRQMPETEQGIAWLWLIDRGRTLDFDFETHFATDAWSIAAKPKREDSNLSLFVSAGPEQPLRGGDAGGLMGSTALPALDLRSLEHDLDQYVDGPRDIDALMRAMAVFDAQSVVQART